MQGNNKFKLAANQTHQITKAEVQQNSLIPSNVV